MLLWESGSLYIRDEIMHGDFNFLSCWVIITLVAVVLLAQVTATNVKCDESENFFLPFWDGGCPAGTERTPDSECCTGCRLCPPGWRQPPMCKGPCLPCTKNTFSNKPVNNENCTSCTVCEDHHRTTVRACSPVYDATCGTCLKGYNEKINSNSTECIECPTEGSDLPGCLGGGHSTISPASACEPPDKDGQCSVSSQLDTSAQCCRPCRKCSPGYTRAPQCYKDCLPCGPGYFSNQENSLQCSPCQTCYKLHRETITECSPVGNARCGNCIESYYEPFKKQNVSVECLKCRRNNTEPSCVQFFDSSDQKASSPVTSEDSGIQHNRILLIVILLVIIVLPIVIFVTKWIKKRGFLNTKRQANEEKQDVHNNQQNGANDPGGIASPQKPLLPENQKYTKVNIHPPVEGESSVQNEGDPSGEDSGKANDEAKDTE